MRGSSLVVGFVVLAALAIAPMVSSSSYYTGVLTTCLIYAIWAVSWDFMSGLTGRENFGYALFIGSGAYTSALINTTFGTSPWLSGLAGIGSALVFAIIIGLPTLRLKGPYFALATLSCSAILQRLTLIFWEQTGGEEGISGLDPLLSPKTYYYFVLAVLAFTLIVLLLLTHSSWGIILRAIRGDEAACQAAGIDVSFHKMAALMVSAAFGGLGGAMYAHYQLQVSPELFSVVTTLTIIIMAYVGGMGSIYGAAGGAIVLTLLTEELREFGQWRLWIYSLVVILIMFFLPNGLIAPLWQKIRGRAS